MFEGGAGGGEKARALRKELGDLEKAERSLDELIHSSSTQLKQLTEYKDNQRYPFQAAVCLSVFSSDSPLCLIICIPANIHLVSAVVTLDHTFYIGLCDIPRHPIHWHSPRPDSHCCQGPC